MSAASSAATAAAIAAAEQQRQLAEEEEEMTPYSSEALAEDWEFKILRSARGHCRDPAKLSQYLAEEARAGWVLVEKFDDSRIRLKRPASARAKDATLEFDPYRIHVGLMPNTHALIIVSVIIGLSLGFLALVVVLAQIFG